MAFSLRPNATANLAKSILSLIFPRTLPRTFPRTSDFQMMKLVIQNAADKSFGLG